MLLVKPGPADAHDAGVAGCHWLSQVPSDAHDAGVVGCDCLIQVQLMLMMLGSWGAIAEARSS